MQLTKLQLTHFKNYERLQAEFNTRVVCFVGNNGEGKTNLLDAIYYTCIGKSYFNSLEKMNIQHNALFLRLDAYFNTDRVEIVYDPKSFKKITKNKVVYEKLSNHLGFAPVSFVAPDDNVIILGGSEFRRKQMNATLSQMNKEYVAVLTKYRKILKQRNSLLKSDNAQPMLLDVYDSQLAPLGTQLHAIRQEYMANFSAIVQNVYNEISEGKETVVCTYKSKLTESALEDLLQENQQKDILLKRTTCGIHKDDVEFLIEGYPLKKYGSQGQQKTFLLALKLAEYQIIKQVLGKEPILLLDDIFDKLDRGRVKQLFQYLITSTNGQIFLSDTNQERLEDVLSQFDCAYGIFTVTNGSLTASSSEPTDEARAKP